MKLTGQQHKQLNEALLSAFPNRAELSQLIYLRLDKSLDEITGNGNLSITVFELVIWAETQGLLHELLGAALLESPRNPLLIEISKLFPNRVPIEESPKLLLRNALLRALPERDLAVEFLRKRFKEIISEVDLSQPLKYMYTDVIRWAEAHGYLRKLVDSARREFPNSKSLQTLAFKWPDWPDGETIKDHECAKGEGSSILSSNAVDSADSVPIQVDVAATVDALRRDGMSRVLAARLRQLRTIGGGLTGSFMLHLHGPWGCGKSSLLNLLRDNLRQDTEDTWITVEFNAWQHQRLGFPWWWLLTAVYQQGISQSPSNAINKRGVIAYLALVGLRTRHTMWLFGRSGLFPYVVAFAIILWAINLLAVPTIIPWLNSLNLTKPSAADNPLTMAGKCADAVIKIVTLITTLLGLLLGAGKLIQRPTAAREFIASSRDPMRDLTQHFNRLVQGLKAPVAVFIDDLDRCDSTYVTELLEGIQTSLREVPIVYVVAADRRWLCASYEKAYETFKDAVAEPGQPLGYLFLDKLFQLSVSIPRVSSGVHAEYLKHLLYAGKASINRESALLVATADDRVEADRLVGNANSDQVWRKAMKSAEGKAPLAQAIREKLALNLINGSVEQEHALAEFAPILRPNPRAMKRFVNAYGIARALDWIAGGYVERGPLALWTILNLQWPLLGDYLADHPEMVLFIREPPISNFSVETNRQDPLAEVPAELRPLFHDRSVRRVVMPPAEICAGLTEESIRACVGIHSDSHYQPVVD